MAPAHNIRGKVWMKNDIHGFTDKQLSAVKPCMLFFIQTLPHILCVNAISCVSFLDLFGPIAGTINPIMKSLLRRIAVSGFEKESNHSQPVRYQGNIFIHIAARSRLSPQMTEPCKQHCTQAQWGIWMDRWGGGVTHLEKGYRDVRPLRPPFQHVLVL